MNGKNERITGKSFTQLYKEVSFENTRVMPVLRPACYTHFQKSEEALTPSALHIWNARELTPMGLRGGIKYVNPQNR